ncbi:MAG: DUF2207 domain-containing protein [Bacilli bacterium]|nr:DUF2207 domain-containing protein [Bacilli bacterium]
MKKIFYLLIILLILPLSVNAITSQNENISVSRYYSDITVLNNGDLLIKELTVLKGNYTEYQRTLQYNEYIKIFDNTNFTDSNIYNGDNIEVISVKGIKIDRDINFDYLYKEGIDFQVTNEIATSSYGLYNINQNENSVTLTMYNPAKNQNGFYIEYVIKNKAVKHNDIAEINYNLNNNNLIIDDLEMTINVSNTTYLQAYAHNFSNNKINVLNTNKIHFKLANIKNNIGIRCLFDKNAINDSNKLTNVNAKANIISFEKTNTYKDNDESLLITLTKYISYLWLLDVLINIIIIIFKNNLIRNDFNKIPSKDDPSLVAFLQRHKITSKDFTASIISLLGDNKIKVEKTDKDYKLIRTDENCDVLENKLIKFLFGVDKEVTLKKIENKIKQYPAIANEEIGSFYSRIILESKIKNYYKTEIKPKVFKFIFAFVGLTLGIVTLFTSSFKTGIFYLGIVTIITAIIYLYLALNVKEKTTEGKNEYDKWMGLKKHLLKYKGNIENERIKLKLFSYSISLNIDNSFSKKFKLNNTNEFKKTFIKKLGKKIDYHLKTSVKSDVGSAIEEIKNEQKQASEKNKEKK